MTDKPSVSPAQANLTLVVAASAAGTVFEWYDFFIFGSLAAIIAQHFFAGAGETQAYLFALLTFAAGFAVRPLGAVVFGWLGDRTGRKRTFLITISLMGLATFLVALLPDYFAIGAAAPYALVALRIVQGFAIGGEYGGAAIYVAEHTHARRRGLATSWIQAAAGLGLALALIVILTVRTLTGEAAFAAYGWRIPFAISLALLALSLWIRLRLDESPQFRQMVEDGTRSAAPLAETFLKWRHLRLVLIALFGLLAGQGVVWYTAQFYSQFFLERITGVPPAIVNALLLAAIIISMPFYILFGWLSDRAGRKPVMLMGLGLAAIGFLPAFQALTAAANPQLARAQAASPVLVIAPPEDCAVQFDLIGKATFDSPCDVAKAALTNRGVAYTNRPAVPGTPVKIRIGGQEIASIRIAGLSRPAIATERKRFDARLRSALGHAGYPPGALPGQIHIATTLGVLVFLLIAAAALYGPQAALLVELFPARIRYTALSVPYHIGVGWFGGFLPATAFAIVAATGNVYAGLYYPAGVAAVSFFIALIFLPETIGRDVEQ